jgi:DedD protein
MDSALKQRLVGAAVLVAVAVIVIPMLLDGPQPELTGESVSLDIPQAPQRDREVREIPLTLPVTPRADTSGTVESERLPTVDIAPANRLDALAESAPPIAPSSAPAAPNATPATSASASSEAPTAPTPSAAPVPTPSATASPGADPQGGFAVNLGSFTKASNAESLRSRLRGAGFPMLVETIDLDGKPATRLRAGPYGTRAEAERARILIGQTMEGVSAAVIALDPTPTRDAPASAIANRAAGWAVQVGAFSTEADALTLRDRLRSGGQPAFVERVPTDKGELFRVRVGPELRREAADALKATLKQRFALDGIVVAHP